jgi:DNA-binding response OmpR family regulator
VSPVDPDEEAWAALDAALRGAPLPEPEASLRERCLPGAVRRRRILAVDDEPNIRRLVAETLGRAGYDVATAADGEQALAEVRRRAPDVIVLDVMMPGPDGFQVLRVLKDDPRTADVPVVMLTARGQLDDIRQGWQRGNDCYLTKPFNPLELRMVVDRIVAALGTPENPPPLRRWNK